MPILGRVNTIQTSRGALDGCVVCAERDERALSTLVLGDGARVVVCGSHDLMYRRSGQVAQTVADLRAITRDRRERLPRREVGDELGERLVAAFAPARRTGTDRRR